MQLIKKENINKTGLLPTVETRGLSRPKIRNSLFMIKKELLRQHLTALTNQMRQWC